MYEHATVRANNMLAFGEIAKGKNGQRYAPIHGEQVLKIETPVFIPFPADVYNGDQTATKCTVEYQTEDHETIDMLKSLDELVLTVCANRSVEMFGKALSKEALEERYVPMCRYREGQALPRLRSKIDLDAVRTWRDGVRIQTPEHRYKGCTAMVCATIRSLWFMNGSFGCTVQTTDIQLMTDPAGEVECPFCQA